MEGARFDAKWEDLNDYLFVNDDGVLEKKNEALKDLTLTKLSVPAKLGGKVVTAIEDETFCGCSHLTTISIPKTVKSIGKCAFADCVRLNSVKLGKALTAIGDEAFSYSPITSIKFPDVLETIGEYAFKYCKFKELLLPNSVSSIGEEAFYHTGIERIKLSKISLGEIESLKKISHLAFYNY